MRYFQWLPPCAQPVWELTARPHGQSLAKLAVRAGLWVQLPDPEPVLCAGALQSCMYNHVTQNSKSAHQLIHNT